MIVVVCHDRAEPTRVLAGSEEQVTMTLHLDAADADAARDLIPVMAGRRRSRSDTRRYVAGRSTPAASAAAPRSTITR